MRKDLGLDWNRGFATVAVLLFLAGAATFFVGACTKRVNKINYKKDYNTFKKLHYAPL